MKSPKAAELAKQLAKDEHFRDILMSVPFYARNGGLIMRTEAEIAKTRDALDAENKMMDAAITLTQKKRKKS